MGSKAVIGFLFGAVIGFAISRLIVNSIPYSLRANNPLIDISIGSILTLGVGLGLYSGLKELEKYEEPKSKFEKSLEKQKVVEEVLHPMPKLRKEREGEEYIMGEVSGKTPDETLSKYFMKLTGGKHHVTPISGREDAFMYDLTRGRYAKWDSYLSKHPEVRDEHPEVQRALFERDIIGMKVDLEAVRKAVAEKKKEEEKNKRGQGYIH